MERQASELENAGFRADVMLLVAVGIGVVSGVAGVVLVLITGVEAFPTSAERLLKFSTSVQGTVEEEGTIVDVCCFVVGTIDDVAANDDGTTVVVVVAVGAAVLLLVPMPDVSAANDAPMLAKFAALKSVLFNAVSAKRVWSCWNCC